MPRDPFARRGTPSALRTIALASVLALAVWACMFRGVRRDIEMVGRLGSVRGTVVLDGVGRGDILVVVYAPGASEAADVFTLAAPGKYLFVLPPGTYRIAAFEDVNGDRKFQPDAERAGRYGNPTDIHLGAGENMSGVDIHLGPDIPARVEIPPRLPEAGSRGVKGLPDIQVGTIVSLDDPRFSAENGRFGMWEPVEFMFTVGAGIYFLEECDASRTPILFVHGIGGYPTEFKYLVGKLDRRRFQPWFAYYPSGLDLDRVADGFARWMQVLQVRCGFRRLVVVAHSMGGLVARAFIERVAGDHAAPTINGIDTFVSISTPWGGHTAAALGVEHAPEVVPAWRDLVPGCPFLESLMGHPLPPGVRYYLFFGFMPFRYFSIASLPFCFESGVLPYSTVWETRTSFGRYSDIQALQF